MPYSPTTPDISSNRLVLRSTSSLPTLVTHSCDLRVYGLSQRARVFPVAKLFIVFFERVPAVLELAPATVLAYAVVVLELFAHRSFFLLSIGSDEMAG